MIHLHSHILRDKRRSTATPLATGREALLARDFPAQRPVAAPLRRPELTRMAASTRDQQKDLIREVLREQAATCRVLPQIFFLSRVRVT